MVRHALGTRTGEWADRLNGLPKYVVSATLDEPKWGNSTVLKGDVVSEDWGETVRVGTVFPVALGTGQRLFGETGDKKPMWLERRGPWPWPRLQLPARQRFTRGSAGS